MYRYRDEDKYGQVTLGDRKENIIKYSQSRQLSRKFIMKQWDYPPKIWEKFLKVLWWGETILSPTIDENDSFVQPLWRAICNILKLWNGTYTFTQQFTLLERIMVHCAVLKKKKRTSATSIYIVILSTIWLKQIIQHNKNVLKWYYGWCDVEKFVNNTTHCFWNNIVIFSNFSNLFW